MRKITDKYKRTLMCICVLFACAEISKAQSPAMEKSAASEVEKGKLRDETVNQLMKNSIDPAAQKLWKAVSYVATEQGVTETVPTTDADWLELRKHADTLIKMSAVLMLPIVKIADAPKTERPAFQYQPQEIEQLRQQNLRDWRDSVQQMQLATQQLIGAIEKKDALLLQELGVPVYRACESCHGQFWYKPGE